MNWTISIFFSNFKFGAGGAQHGVGWRLEFVGGSRVNILIPILNFLMGHSWLVGDDGVWMPSPAPHQPPPPPPKKTVPERPLFYPRLGHTQSSSSGSPQVDLRYIISSAEIKVKFYTTYL